MAAHDGIAANDSDEPSNTIGVSNPERGETCGHTRPPAARKRTRVGQDGIGGLPIAPADHERGEGVGDAAAAAQMASILAMSFR